MSAPAIRSRTTVLVVVTVALVWLVAATLTWRSAREEASEVFDGHLAQAASMLIAQTAMEIEEPEELGGELHAPQVHRYARRVAFQVWGHGTELLVHSENAPNVRLSGVEEGFSDSLLEGQRWRVFSGWNARREMLVQVGERTDARDEMAEELAEGLLKPLLWGLPLLALLIWLAIGRAMRPLNMLAGEIAHRSPDRLDALEGVPVPREVEPLVMRLNALLGRVAAALNAEKRFTGDAAHELRTPIAALSAQAEVALASSDEAGRRKALEAVLLAARRMARLVEQLLTLARADSALESAWPEVDLASLVREVVGEAAPGAVERGLDLGVDAPDSLAVCGEEGWLRILLRNLLENALRYTPEGGVVTLRVADEGPSMVLEVRDSGPGVPDPARLGERFWRANASGSGSGSGLGLSIVRRVAELHGAAVEFSNANKPGQGLVVRVRFKRRVASPGGP